MSPVRHVHVHLRFYASILVGVTVGLLAAWLDQPALAPGGDAFYLTYLLATAHLRFPAQPEEMRRTAAVEDEGVRIIIALTLAAIAISTWSLVSLLADGGHRQGWTLALGVLSVPLGWTTLHTVMAIRYAHLYYDRHPERPGEDAGGLDFPQPDGGTGRAEGRQEPDMSDFLYYAFVIGMTAQVSDVQATGRVIRRTTLAHSIVAFFYNTVILALAVNIAVTLSQ
ncbi:DUF1345 domain-containing protein [Zavarzinia sp. CC-PAN008]|uniref:DUF1345 domain-containing protein n=1 Tax=Zavarzinia sp. CC-PAN008 TaxID=3243332 RepID=UPI003F746FAE